MDLAEAVAVLVAGILAASMTDGLVSVAPFFQAGVDVVLVGMDEGTFGDVASMIGRMVACCTLASI